MTITQDTDPHLLGDWFAGEPTGPKKHWHMRLSRKLTDEEREAYHKYIEENGDVTWDAEEGHFSMTQTLWLIEKVAPDVEVVAYWHSPYIVVVNGLYDRMQRGYEIENAPGKETAIEKAKSQWHEQFKHLGFKATILEAHIATKKDLKKLEEDKSARHANDE